MLLQEFVRLSLVINVIELSSQGSKMNEYEQE